MERVKKKLHLRCSTKVHLQALADLGRDEQLPVTVQSLCDSFLCQLISTKKNHGKTAAELRWSHFTGNSGVDKMPPTSGAWHHHIFRAHMQANVWHQDLVLNPKQSDPCKYVWCGMSNGRLTAQLSEISAAPSAIVQLVKCGCGISRCTRKCSCKENDLSCTDLCKCEGGDVCENSFLPIQSPEKDEFDSDDETDD